MKKQFPFYIHSIYPAIEGEGMHIGQAQVFVRFQGCAIGCINCDSMDTWEFDEKTSTSLENIINKVQQQQLRRVSITGGDPLHPGHEQSLLALVKALKERGYYINIEAAGARLSHKVFDLINFISFDIKTPSTGVETPLRNVVSLVEQYQGKYQIKSVISGEKDFRYVLQIREKLAQLLADNGVAHVEDVPWFLTPCWETGHNAPVELVKQVYQWNLQSGGLFRVVSQQHKWIFGSEEKLV